jgi:hypothetical protein
MDMGGGAVFGLGGPDAGAHDRHEQLGTAGAIVRIADSGRRISTGTVRLWPGSSRSSVRSGGSSGPARPSCSSIGREAWAEVMSPDSARSVSAWEAWLVSTRRHDSVALTSVALSRSARSVTARPAGTSTGGGAMGAGAGTGAGAGAGRGGCGAGELAAGPRHGRVHRSFDLGGAATAPGKGGEGHRQRAQPGRPWPPRRAAVGAGIGRNGGRRFGRGAGFRRSACVGCRRFVRRGSGLRGWEGRALAWLRASHSAAGRVLVPGWRGEPGWRRGWGWPGEA